MSNLKSMSFTSKEWATGALILNQVKNLVEAWNSINDAQNKIDASLVTIQIIRRNVDEISNDVDLVEALKETWEKENLDEEKTKMMTRIRTITSRSLGLYNVTDIKIKNLKQSIDGTTEALMKQQRSQRWNMLSTAAHFTVNVLQYCSVGQAATGTLKIEQGLVAALIVSNGVMYYIARMELSKPRKINNQILNLRAEEWKSAIDESLKWIKSKDRGRQNYE